MIPSQITVIGKTKVDSKTKNFGLLFDFFLSLRLKPEKMAQSTVKNFFNPIIRPIAKPIDEFIKLEQASSIILMVCSVLSLLVANSPFSSDYIQFWDINTSLQFGSFKFEKSIAHWIDDGLMAIFFLLVGLEIKREVLEGQLSTLKKALLPFLCAIGGMVFPALFYVAFNYNTPFLRGWGIPMATDIAFCLAIVSLLGNRVPLALKVFLAALAIADDLGAVLVIAFFYTSEINFDYLIAVAALVSILFALNAAGIKSLVVYWICGFLLWFFTLKSGIHATISGVILAFFVPFKTEFNKQQLLDLLQEKLGLIKDNLQSPDVKPRDIAEELEDLTDHIASPSQMLEHQLHSFVAYFVMPVFALCNTGFLLSGNVIEELNSSMSWGIMLGLVLGKPIGIFLTAFISVKLNIATLPDDVQWSHLVGAGLLAGIGFTMSIFTTLLAFPDQLLIQSGAKSAILLASLLAGILGFLFLRFVPKNIAH
jgi:Na+:H+ antiporter, NhaA family